MQQQQQLLPSSMQPPVQPPMQVPPPQQQQQSNPQVDARKEFVNMMRSGVPSTEIPRSFAGGGLASFANPRGYQLGGSAINPLQLQALGGLPLEELELEALGGYEPPDPQYSKIRPVAPTAANEPRADLLLHGAGDPEGTGAPPFYSDDDRRFTGGTGTVRGLPDFDPYDYLRRTDVTVPLTQYAGQLGKKFVLDPLKEKVFDPAIEFAKEEIFDPIKQAGSEALQDIKDYINPDLSVPEDVDFYSNIPAAVPDIPPRLKIGETDTYFEDARIGDPDMGAEPFPTSQETINELIRSSEDIGQLDPMKARPLETDPYTIATTQADASIPASFSADFDAFNPGIRNIGLGGIGTRAGLSMAQLLGAGVPPDQAAKIVGGQAAVQAGTQALLPKMAGGIPVAAPTAAIISEFLRPGGPGKGTAANIGAAAAGALAQGAAAGLGSLAATGVGLLPGAALMAHNILTNKPPSTTSWDWNQFRAGNTAMRKLAEMGPEYSKDVLSRVDPELLSEWNRIKENPSSQNIGWERGQVPAMLMDEINKSIEVRNERLDKEMEELAPILQSVSASERAWNLAGEEGSFVPTSAERRALAQLKALQARRRTWQERKDYEREMEDIA